jgi:hypothetical protein
MRLPEQSPPVSRAPARSRERARIDPRGEMPQASLQGQGQGIGPSDYQDCYSLRGLAQQLCLANY